MLDKLELDNTKKIKINENQLSCKIEKISAGLNNTVMLSNAGEIWVTGSNLFGLKYTPETAEDDKDEQRTRKEEPY
jgi:alpha-tubulin suppressor-like RCC1 family protein